MFKHIFVNNGNNDIRIQQSYIFDTPKVHRV